MEYLYPFLRWKTSVTGANGSGQPIYKCSALDHSRRSWPATVVRGIIVGRYTQGRGIVTLLLALRNVAMGHCIWHSNVVLIVVYIVYTLWAIVGYCWWRYFADIVFDITYIHSYHITVNRRSGILSSAWLRHRPRGSVGIYTPNGHIGWNIWSSWFGCIWRLC